MQHARPIFALYAPGLNLPKINSMLADTDAFADAVVRIAPDPITTNGMVKTIASYEAVILPIANGYAVRL